MKRLFTLLAAAGAAVALVRGPQITPLEELTADLDTILGGERKTYQWREGAISYRVAGSGPPLLLVHGINAAAASYEVRHNFSGLSQQFRVYAIDLLGFGLSDRPALRYTADTYVALLRSFLADVIGEPTHVVASSLSSAYAISAAHAEAELVKTLVVICPTGIDKLASPPVRGQKVVDAIFGAPLIGRQLFAWLISRASVSYFLRKMTYHDLSFITPQMIDLLHRLGQRPGARFAPQAFVAGRLNLNIADKFGELTQPVLIAWGKYADTTTLAGAPAFLERNPRAVLKVFDASGLLPHDEQAAAFNAAVIEWIEGQKP